MLVEVPKSNKMELEKLPEFPSIEDAKIQRQKDEGKLLAKQKCIDKMRSKLSEMEEADLVSGAELLQYTERKQSILNRMAKLNTQKKKAELEYRRKQCEVLNVTIEMEEGAQVDENVMAEDKRKVAELEAKLEECIKEIVGVREELEEVERQVQEAEESRAGAAQLGDIIRSELADEEIEFNSLKEQLASSSSHIKELVAKQQKHIAAQAAMCEAEWKMAYDRARARIREREREWLNALNKYVEDEVLPNDEI